MRCSSIFYCRWYRGNDYLLKAWVNGLDPQSLVWLISAHTHHSDSGWSCFQGNFGWKDQEDHGQSCFDSQRLNHLWVIIGQCQQLCGNLSKPPWWPQGAGRSHDFESDIRLSWGQSETIVSREETSKVESKVAIFKQSSHSLVPNYGLSFFFLDLPSVIG